ncbi:MAG: hypothetical protein QOE54_7452 [Streptosporangiaceae bacterium]|nr:hypothetical protein [Streptosporangiaceae bacterium]
MRLAMAGLVVTLLMTGACGSSSSTTTAPTTADGAARSAPGSTGTSSLTVMLKDSPFSDAKALLVTFSEVNVHASGGGWVTVPFAGGASSRTCDLKKLETAQDILGVGPLPAGHYTQLRLVVSSAAIYLQNASSGPACAPAIATPAGTNAPVDIPSGELKLNREFDLTSNGGTTILLDFDGDQSVKLTGNDNGHGNGGGKYIMTPVIGIVSVH